MKIFVSVKINKNKEKIDFLSNNSYLVRTKLPAKENKANFDVIRQLAEFFDIPKSQVILKSGAKSSKKVFEIIK